MDDQQIHISCPTAEQRRDTLAAVEAAQVTPREREHHIQGMIDENLRQRAPLRDYDFPRPFELRLVANCEPAWIHSWRWRLAIRLCRLAARLIGWRAHVYVWDSRGPSMAHPHPCPCHFTRRVE